MYDLFNSNLEFKKGTKVFPNFRYIREGILLEIQKYRDYYRSTIFSVLSEHLLVQILSAIIVPTNRGNRYFIDSMSDITGQLSRNWHLSSPVYRGDIKPTSILYGKDVREVVIATNEEFDIKYATENWRDLSPVTVLRHPFNDLSLPRLIGQYPYPNRNGEISVVAINIPMLAYQALMWEQKERGKLNIAPSTLQEFVAAYPITNAITTHTDIAFFNRLSKHLREKSVSEFEIVNPFNLINWTDKVDKILEGQVELIKNSDWTFPVIMDNTPELSANNLMDAMELPYMPLTSQVGWVVLLARMPLMRFLLYANRYGPNSANDYYLSKITIALRQLRSDRTIMLAITHELQDEIFATLSQSSSLYY